MEWQGQQVLVTGGRGFLGHWLVKVLAELGASVVAPHRDQFDLTSPEQTHELLETGRFQVVFHLAGRNGGIQTNLSSPAAIFHDNSVMAFNLLEACRGQSLKFVGIVASCAYGDNLEGVMREQEFFAGLPHPSVLGHGMAKRNLQMGCHLYHQQYGLDAVCVCPTTLFGPRDDFDLNRTKVMGGLIRRIVDAMEEEQESVTISAHPHVYREFLYVEDAARLIVQAAEKYNNHYAPLNLSFGDEIALQDLAKLIGRLAGYQGEILFDESLPAGQRRKHLDCRERLCREITLPNPTSLEEGIRRTIDYYRNNAWLWRTGG